LGGCVARGWVLGGRCAEEFAWSRCGRPRARPPPPLVLNQTVEAVSGIQFVLEFLLAQWQLTCDVPAELGVRLPCLPTLGSYHSAAIQSHCRVVSPRCASLAPHPAASHAPPPVSAPRCLHHPALPSRAFFPPPALCARSPPRFPRGAPGAGSSCAAFASCSALPACACGKATGAPRCWTRPSWRS
jgi:hypothetical protein